jgi:two-component system chemotaxis sensor kinase CheA
MIEPAGYKVIEAVDGLDALQKVKEGQPDVVILDILMPGLDGIAVCKKLRQAEATATLPIILLTGQAQLSVINKGIEAGANLYLTKPMTRKQLLDALQSLRKHFDEA